MQILLPVTYDGVLEAMKQDLLAIISCADNGAKLTEETVADAANIPAYRVRAELKRLGIETLTREAAIVFIARRNEEAVLRLADMYRNTVAQNNRDRVSIDSLIQRINAAENKAEEQEQEISVKSKEAKLLAKRIVYEHKLPQFKHSPVSASELAEWAGVQLAPLVAKIMNAKHLHELMELFPFPEDNPTMSATGAIVAARTFKLRAAS